MVNKKSGFIDTFTVLLVAILLLLPLTGCQGASVVSTENTASPLTTVGPTNAVETLDVTQPSTAPSEEPTTTPVIQEQPPISFEEQVNRETYILPDSNKKLLVETDLEELPASMLDKARNEIYARHGYVFTGNDNKYYFTNKSWYKENADFNESMLNDTEKCNALFIKQYSEKAGECFKLVQGNETLVDLDGDGTEERIKLDCTAGSNSYTLSVNGKGVAGDGNNMDGKLFVCDIDSKDNNKELAITESGPSSDEATYFYYYDGTNINLMGRIQGSDYVINMNGSGTFTSRTRGRILQTWFYTDRYGMSATHQLKNIPQKLYKMGTRVRAQKELKLQKSPSDKAIATVLEPGNIVVITASDNREWCEVDNLKGVKGWFAVDNFEDIRGAGFNASECFEGLCFAD